MVAAAASSGDDSTNTCRNPRAAIRASTAQLSHLVAYDVRPKLPVRPLLVAILALSFRQVQHDCHRQHVVFPRQRHQWLARFRLHVGRIDHRQQPARQPLAGHVMQQVECVIRGVLRVFIVETRPRQKSDESTSVGAKFVRANVLLPEPEQPTITTSESFGILSSMQIKIAA